MSNNLSIESPNYCSHCHLIPYRNWRRLTSHITQNKFILCTDGGACQHQNIGSFGWVLSTQQDRIIVSHKGTVAGGHVDSFRAKAMSPLLALQYLVVVQNFYGYKVHFIDHITD